MRKFDPILQLAQDSQNELSDIQTRYDKVCRSQFTHKKSLAKCKEQWNSSSADVSDRATDDRQKMNPHVARDGFSTKSVSFVCV